MINLIRFICECGEELSNGVAYTRHRCHCEAARNAAIEEYRRLCAVSGKAAIKSKAWNARASPSVPRARAIQNWFGSWVDFQIEANGSASTPDQKCRLARGAPPEDLAWGQLKLDVGCQYIGSGATIDRLRFLYVRIAEVAVAEMNGTLSHWAGKTPDELDAIREDAECFLHKEGLSHLVQAHA